MNSHKLSIEEIKREYLEILKEITASAFMFHDACYSEICLPFPFEEHQKAKPKVMIVGRETAKTTRRKINANDTLVNIVDDAYLEYIKHIKKYPDGKIKTKSKSHFKRYFFEIAGHLGIDPRGMIYANMFAWDYNKKSPLKLPKDEFLKIKDISLKLLAKQIELFKPNFIVFATGCNKIDPLIKELFNNYFQGYKTENIIKRQLWEFSAAGARCFRIAHPRAQHKHHQNCRDEVIKRIQLLSK
jgi:hypothetical protein